MPHPKTSIIDYRNARYQGHVDNQENRQNLGILVNDDLSFYVSNWKNNLLNGQTLVYISHGKYIYGDWLNNQPNGMNVFRTGDTVLVGEFQNGKIVGKALVIFQRYNIIALLQAKNQKDKFDVLKCGKLLKHEDLLDYIDMLDVGMPDQYFSLIKFVTSFVTEENEDGEALIASPCDGQNCYFGYRDGLAIVFNSNNGVVSVGKHENKQVSGFGGKFDGKNIQEGNFQMKETIIYHKKRPTNQIYAIFQKMHKRSLNFKNQYFDSKVKTLEDLQLILRGNIQKIVNYNMKHRIDEATTQDLNDSLDYQNLGEEDSLKCAENRHNMYDRQNTYLKKTTSQYCRQDEQTKSVGKLTKPTTGSSITVSNQKRPSRILIEQSQNCSYDYNNEQTVRKTPNKQSSVSYAKKSPIRYRQEDKQVYQRPSRSKKYLPEPEPQSQKGSQRQSRANSTYQNIDKASMYTNQINVDKSKRSSEVSEKLPKFGGLQAEETAERNHKKSTVQMQVQEYKKQLDKSRSRQKVPGQSLGKCLKRPNYEDIQDRRKRILNQFKQLNDSNSNSKVSNVSNQRRTPHKMSVQIEINDNSRNSERKQILQSPCMKQNILSFTSENENGTQNSEEGCLPLSLVNNERLKNNKNRQYQPKNEKLGSAFTKKSSIIQRLDSSYNRNEKQNLSYTPGTFTKYKKDLQNIKVEVNTSDKRREVRRFYCRQSQQQIQPVNMPKKSQSNHWLSQNQQEDENQFKQIKLRHQVSQNIEPTYDMKTILDDKPRNFREKTQSFKEKQVNNSEKREFTDKSVGKYQRDVSPLGNDLSRKKVYKYYFDD